MGQPKQVRQVYAELRRFAPDALTSEELLESSAALVELMNPPESKFSLRVGGLPFDQWAVDAAMADGGWRILSREGNSMCSFFEDIQDSVSREIETREKLREYATA